MASYSEQEKRAIWNEAGIINGKNPDHYRRDPYGNTIMYSKYGDETPMGWEVDHIIPRRILEINELWNLQAMQSVQNASLGYDLSEKKTRYNGLSAQDVFENYTKYLLNKTFGTV